jgi:MoaA/NifB/PqqE/SkfB family radical SAM enzyme
LLNKGFVSLENIIKWFPSDFIESKLSSVLLSGATAEPTLNPECIDIVTYFSRFIKDVSIDTNGSTNNEDWWYELGKTGCRVIFAVDSIKPNNNLYRINANTDKIISNIKSFVKGGGVAEWKMILFKHNQDEIDECRSISKELGCAYFTVRHSNSFKRQSSHQIITKQKKYTIERNQFYEQIESISTNKSNPEDYCLLTKEKIIIVFSNGIVYPCCFTESGFFEFYGPFFMDENNTKPVITNDNFYKSFVQVIERQGGIKTLSLKYYNIEEIFNTNLYKTAIQLSWKMQSNSICQNCPNFETVIDKTSHVSVE